MDIEALRWFDRWLKGIDNGIDTEPPVLIYVINGDGWRQEKEWPLARQQMVTLFLDEGSTLTGGPAVQGADDYMADYSHHTLSETLDVGWYKDFYPAPVSDLFYLDRFLAASGDNPQGLPLRTETGKKSLAYTTVPLASDAEMTGHPEIRIWVTSTADYGDFYFYLEDVDENGEAVLVTRTQLRAGFADLHDNDEMISSTNGIDVLPDLPWHGFERSDFVHGIFGQRGVVELTLDFQPVSWVFKEGHRIRLSIACSDWPNFRLHPVLCPANDPNDPQNIVPTITVLRDAAHPSQIRLPYIPAGSGG